MCAQVHVSKSSSDLKGMKVNTFPLREICDFVLKADGWISIVQLHTVVLNWNLL